MPANMRWQNFEQLIANSIRNLYQQLTTDDERRLFCQQIHEADVELRDTSSSNPNYNLPRIGEAYVLKYHLGRADNLYTALNYIHQQNPLPANLRVLDIGSGTGGSMMATVLWVANYLNTSLINLEIYGIEPMPIMREMADYLRQPFLQLVEQTANLASGSVARNVRHALNVSSLQELADLETSQRFNLIIFSFTFSVLNADEQQSALQEISRVSNLLESGGILLFLVPNKPISKQEFRQRIIEHLANINTNSKLEINVSTGKHIRYASSERPAPIIEVRRGINRECRRLGVEQAFGEDPKWDDPYYGFFCTLDVFVKN